MSNPTEKPSEIIFEGMPDDARKGDYLMGPVQLTAAVRRIAAYLDEQHAASRGDKPLRVSCPPAPLPSPEPAPGSRAKLEDEVQRSASLTEELNAALKSKAELEARVRELESALAESLVQVQQKQNILNASLGLLAISNKLDAAEPPTESTPPSPPGDAAGLIEADRVAVRLALLDEIAARVGATGSLEYGLSEVIAKYTKKEAGNG